MSSQKAKAELKEIENINKEINRLRSVISGLNKKKKKLEEGIKEYSNNTKQSTVKNPSCKISAEVVTKPIRQRKKESEKIHDCNDVLKKYGVRNGKMMMDELFEAMRGNPVDTEKVVYKNVK